MTSAGNLTADAAKRQLSEEIEHLKDQLLALLRKPTDEVTALSAKEAYRMICYNMDTWVSNVIEDSSSDIKPSRLGRRGRHQLKHLKLDYPSANGSTSIPSLLLTLAIRDRVRSLVFDRAYPVGITSDQGHVLDQVLQGMKSLESANGE